MAVRVLDSLGRRSGLPGKKAGIYTVSKYGGMRVTGDPMGILVYSTVDQAIPSGGWVAVNFDTALFPPASYGMPVMWSSGSIVYILESGWYILSASLWFTAPAADNTYLHFRFRTVSGMSLPGGGTYVPKLYESPISDGVPYYLNAGDGVLLDVYQASGGYMTLYGGVGYSNLSVGRFGS